MLLTYDDLKMDRIDPVHAAHGTLPLREHIRAVSVGKLGQDVQPMQEEESRIRLVAASSLGWRAGTARAT